MTADQAREITVGLNSKLQRYITEIDEEIQKACDRGCRHIETDGGPVGYNDDLVRYYRNNGFEVHHYVSPFDKLEILW